MLAASEAGAGIPPLGVSFFKIRAQGRSVRGQNHLDLSFQRYRAGQADWLSG